MTPQNKRQTTVSDSSRLSKKRKIANTSSDVSKSTFPPTTAPVVPKTPRRRRITHHRIAPLKPSSDQAISNRPSSSGLNNPTREIRGRDVIFVTRKTGLGMYLRRCKALLVDEGLNHITLHALCASIPHSLLLLHALLDILPYPKQYVNYEIRTSTVECTDEVFGKNGADDEEMEVFEEEAGEMRTRLKSSLEIIIRIGKPARSSTRTTATATSRTPKPKSSRKARPSKAARAARRRANEGVDESENERMIDGGVGFEEEEMMNAAVVAVSASEGSQQEKGKAKVVGKKAGMIDVVDLTKIDEEDIMNE